MRLPNAEQAEVDKEEITEYPLSFSSVSGESEAYFFSRFGFRIERWEDMSDALISRCLRHEVTEVKPPRLYTPPPHLGYSAR